MINSTGVPARNSLVQKDRRQVCEVIHSYLGLIVTISLFPFLCECLICSLIPAIRAMDLMARLNSALEGTGIFFANLSSRIFFASVRKGITTHRSDFSCFL